MSAGPAPRLAAESVSYTYATPQGGVTALERVSLAVAPREFVCVLGPSGSGKSTLLRLLAGLLRPTSGQVLFEGQPLAGPRRRIGLVFQKANLMPWRTVLANIRLPLEVIGTPPTAAEARARELAALVGLTGFEDALPRRLSGGMEQRVALARALSHRPDVLLMDEPFGALDALTRERMGAELLRIWEAEQQTVVLVTHSIAEALLLADRVIVLSARPGQVRLNLPVPLPRPRAMDLEYTPAFAALARQLRSEIE